MTGGGRKDRATSAAVGNAVKCLEEANIKSKNELVPPRLRLRIQQILAITQTLAFDIRKHEKEKLNERQHTNQP